MNNLPLPDILFFGICLIATLLTGVYFTRKIKNSDQYYNASGLIPGWAIGLSISARFFSGNTFPGVPGRAFGSNRDAFFSALLCLWQQAWRQNIVSYF